MLFMLWWNTSCIWNIPKSAIARMHRPAKSEVGGIPFAESGIDAVNGMLVFGTYGRNGITRIGSRRIGSRKNARKQKDMEGGSRT